MIFSIIALYLLSLGSSDSSGSSVSTRWLVEFSHAPTSAELAQTRELSHAADLERFDTIDEPYFKRLYQLTAPGTSLPASVTSLSFIQRIEKPQAIAQLDSIVPPTTPRVSQKDVLFPYQWGLVNQGQLVLRDIDDLSQEKLTGSNLSDIDWVDSITDIEASMTRAPVVAVVDSGVTFDHPDLRASILKNTSECGSTGMPILNPTADRDGNGYVGDCVGWNFADSVTGNSRPTDDLGHGTHVAGIIAAQAGNMRGIRGVSDRIKILPVKVLGSSDQDGGGEGPVMSDRLARGILYAVKRGVDVINLSLGWPTKMDSPMLREAVGSALRRGITVVAAAGNNSHDQPVFPCGYEGVICVGASDITGHLAPFSNYGAQVDVLAPGEEILSTFPLRITPKFFHVTGYEVKNGTSQAAPFVSAAVALLKAARPGITEDEIKARLYAGALPAPEGTTPMAGVPTEKRPVLNGVMRLGAMFRAQITSWVQPVSKEPRSWEVEIESGTAEGEIALHNYGVSPATLTVVVSAAVPASQESWDGTWTGTLAAGESYQLKTVGRGIDPTSDDHRDLLIRVRTESSDRTFTRSVHLIRKLNTERDLTHVPFQFTGPAIALVSGEGRLLSSLLSSIPDPLKLSSTPSFFTSSIHDGLVELRVFEGRETSIQEIPRTLKIPGVERLLSVQKVDANFDGAADYWVTALHETDTQSELVYAFFNSSGQPLWGETRSVWHYQPEAAVPQNPIGWLSIQDPVLGRVPGIAFQSSGPIPAAAQNPDPWVARDGSVGPHWYYLTPKLVNGRIELTTRLIDDWKWRAELLKRRPPSRPQLDESDWVPLGMLPQSSDDLRAGTATFLVSIGRDFERFTYAVKTSGDGSFTESALDLGILRLEGTQLSSDDVSGTDVVGFQNDSTARFSRLDGNGKVVESWIHQETDPREPLVGFLTGFARPSETQAIFQTRRFLVAHTHRSDGVDVISRRPIYRFSFLPGKVFNSWFLRVHTATGDSGFYIDSSSITEPVLQWLVLKNGIWTAPISEQIKIPDGCLAMNPTEWPGKSGSRRVLLCRTAADQAPELKLF